MKIFASLDSHLPPAASSVLVGRQVATSTFLQALLQRGDFDQYHFFLGDQLERDLFVDAYRPTCLAHGIWERVKLNSRLSLLDHIRTTDYHVFHQGDFVTYFASLAALRNRFASVRFPISAPIHSISYPAYLQVYQRLLMEASAYDSIVCTSRAGQRAMMAGLDVAKHALAELCRDGGVRPFFGPRLDLIPLGIDIDTYRPPREPERWLARQSLQMPRDAVCILSCGRFSAADKFDLFPLLRAFGRVLKTRKLGGPAGVGSVRLLLAGAAQGDSYADQVQQIVGAMGLADTVRLFVDVTAPDKLRLLHAADIFVSPSDNLQETFGLSVLEAMACGLPVVASDWDGYRDLVANGETGILVPTYAGDWDRPLGLLGPVAFERNWHLAVAQATIVDVRQLAEAMGTLAFNPNLRLRMGRAGRNQAERFSLGSVLDQYVKLWDASKQQAKADTSSYRATSGTFARPFELFPDHASDCIRETLALGLTDLGQALIQSESGHPWYADLDPWMEMHLLRHLCSLVGQKLTAGEAVMRVCRSHHADEEKVRYQLSWLIKHDYLEILHAGETASGKKRNGGDRC